MLKDLVKKARSCRRFDNTFLISNDDLKDIIDTARLTPSAANRQPVRFIVANNKAVNEKIFSYIGWAAYLADWKGPAPEEQPSAYIVLYSDMQFTPHLSIDPGIIAQTINLSANEKGLATCIIASFDKNKIKRVVHLEKENEIILIIAVGKAAENVVLEDVGEDGSIKYWRDEDDVHHVPKRKLDDILRFVE